MVGQSSFRSRRCLLFGGAPNRDFGRRSPECTVLDGRLQEVDNITSDLDLGRLTAPRRSRAGSLGAGPVEPRTTSSGSKKYSSAGTVAPDICCVQELDDHPAHRLDRLANCSQRRVRAGHQRGVVVALRSRRRRDTAAPGAPRRADRTESHSVAGTHYARHAASDQPRSASLSRLERVEPMRDPPRRARSRPQPSAAASGGDHLAARRYVIGGTEEETDSSVT